MHKRSDLRFRDQCRVHEGQTAALFWCCTRHLDYHLASSLFHTHKTCHSIAY